MNEISTKVKSLNFFQRLRMEHIKNLLRKNRMSIDKFLKLPEYIQYNHTVLAMATHTFEDDELRRIEPSAICTVNQDYDFLRGYTDEILFQLIQSGVISINYKNEALVYDLISSGYYEILDNIEPSFNIDNYYTRLISEGKTEQARSILSHLSNEFLLELCNENSSIINMLPVEKQIILAAKETSFIQYLPIEEQHKIIKQSSFGIWDEMSLDAKIAYIRDNPGDILAIDKVQKNRQSILGLVVEDVSLFEILPNEWKREIQQDFDNPINSKIFAQLLLKDLKCSKFFNIESSRNGIERTISELFKNHEDFSYELIIDLCLHSKMLSAIGKLSSVNHTLHEGGVPRSEIISGIDGYTSEQSEQIEIIQSLNINVIKELVKIDSNYVLPYLSGKEVISEQTHEEMTSAEDRAKSLFTTLYGEDKYSEYAECFTTIFNLEEEYTQDNGKNPVEVPLEEFKILFNSTIMEKCEPELIKKYFEALKNHEETRTLFENIIQEAYGDRALEILKSRPQLNVHSINSLEVFDSRILDEYGEGFVHDCISYNIRNFSEFLDAIKSPEKNELFKNYYDILTGIYGNNVETMQKAISEFSYVEDILKQVKDVDLTNEQALNLINVLCSEKNPLNIETLEDLNNYNDLANEQLQNIISEFDGRKEITFYEEEYLREVICQNILGIGYRQSRERGYGSTLGEICALYDISEGESSKGDYAPEEKKMLEIMNFIRNEVNHKKLLAFIKNLGDVTTLRNFTAVAKVIDKVQEKELSEMNKHITTLEKLDEICEKEQDSETPTVYREEIDGVKIYHLNGEPFTMFGHDPGNASVEDLLHFEGQSGNTAICMRLCSPNKGASFYSGMYYYGEIPNKGIITISNQDAGTTHVAKRTKMFGNTEKKVTQLEEVNRSGNEVAMYRRQRDHSRIGNRNVGGNIPPMAYGVFMNEDGTILHGGSIEEFAKEFQGTGISILVYHSEAYREQEQSQERGNATKSQEDDFSR